MHENELFVLLLSTLVWVFMMAYRDRLAHLPEAHWLWLAFLAAYLAWVATVVEHWVWPNFFNAVEHLGYALNGVLLLIWCVMVTVKGRKKDELD